MSINLLVCFALGLTGFCTCGIINTTNVQKAFAFCSDVFIMLPCARFTIDKTNKGAFFV